MNQNIELIRSKRKTLAIEITPEARVIVRAPLRLSVTEINRFIGEKADWIDAHVRKMQERQKAREYEPEASELSKQEIKLLVTRAKRIIPQRVRYYAGMMDVTYGNITIRMQK
ncbi:MAG: M48 family metallopeptidase, partial [Butyrivibrio sp.]|nr:M48 family metallopeptidase [Butyrivibrio sp.]